jgi:hypothetical protein
MTSTTVQAGNSKVDVMLPNSQAEPKSRWAAFIERWDDRFTRFRNCFDPTAETPDRTMRIWAITLVSIGVVVLGALIVVGAMWVYNHPRSFVVIHFLLKGVKYAAIGIALVTAMLCRDKLAKIPLFARFRSSGATPVKE